MGAVLGEAAVAGLHVAELALDYPERMLDLRPDHGDDPVARSSTGCTEAPFGALLMAPQTLPGPANAPHARR